MKLWILLLCAVFSQSTPAQDSNPPRKSPEQVAADIANYKIECDAGNAKGCFGLGLMLAHNDRPAEAIPAFERSAQGRNANAMMFLGKMYEDGTGVPQDFVVAHMWGNLAHTFYTPGSIGKIGMEGRQEVLERRMTREQIAEAQRRARDWFEKNKN
jgi:TPR repeat protein